MERFADRPRRTLDVAMVGVMDGPLTSGVLVRTDSSPATVRRASTGLTLKP